MAANIPMSMKSSGIAPIIARAHQVEKVKPAVAYWCYYWAVQQIVTKDLHNSDDESKAYTGSLMDKLEAFKKDNAGQDAFIDEVAAKAYVEQFGLEIFDRADSAIRNDKTTKQTADTFQAAYTFLEVLNIWPPLDPEIATKIKFSKFHALRIAKAVKNGEDPNPTNPPKEPAPTTEASSLDPMDPEVQALGGLGGPQPSHQPFSVDASHPDHPYVSTDSADFSATAPTPSSSHKAAEQFYRQPSGGDVSPLEPSSHDRASSEGGGYFPQVSPTTAGHGSAFISSTGVRQVPGIHGGAFDSPSAPQPVSPIHPSPTHSLSGRQPYPSQQPLQASDHTATGQISPPVPPLQTNQPSSSQPAQVPQPVWEPSRQIDMPAVISPQPTNTEGPYVTDDDAVAKAQKHARWAISALNFEDVNTAVREFRNALQTLGAR